MTVIMKTILVLLVFFGIFLFISNDNSEDEMVYIKEHECFRNYDVPKWQSQKMFYDCRKKKKNESNK